MTAVLGLGTVQFGLDYGIGNPDGRPPADQVAVILADARTASVRTLDTAALYGASEKILGMCDLSGFQVVTKTPRFATSPIETVHADELITTFYKSLKKLRQSAVEGLLVHHASDLLAAGGDTLWLALRELKDQGLVRSIGVSIYENDQVDTLLKRYDPDLVQLPINVLDHRLIEGGYLERLRQHGVEVHARSVFLQGLLLMEPDRTPDHFAAIRPLLRRWHQTAREQGLTAAQAALAFVRDLPGINVVLVGVNDRSQFRNCVDDFSCAKHFDARGLACNDPVYTNPSMWA